MKVNQYEQQQLHEDRIDFYYRGRTKEVNEILNYLAKHSQRLTGKIDDTEMTFSLKDVCYFESVDKMSFAYLDDKVVRIDVRLRDLESAYFELGFVRVNKSTILNVYKIDSLKSELNMRVIALLNNGEKIQINRSYKARFNQFLRKMDEGGCQNEADQ